MKCIHTDSAPAAVGPYSQAKTGGNYMFISGQLPIVPSTGKFISDDVSEQTEQALRNMGEILKVEDLSYGNVIKTTVLLADIADFAAMNTVYAKFFTGDYPARVAYQVAALPLGAKVEIDAIAYKG